MNEITPEPIASTPPTPENVAAMLAYRVGSYHDGNDWELRGGADGNVVRVDIEPYADPDYKTSLPEQHFRAVVVEGAAVKVADEPTVLDVPTARELAYCDPGDTIDGWTVVANECIQNQRWESLHRLVIRNEAGEHFKDTYRKGLTEGQDTGPYEYATTATFTPVVPKYKVVTDWVSAEAAQAEQNGGQS